MLNNIDLCLKQTILTVSQLNRAARECLETTFETVWVFGEISNLAAPSSGHLYFTLKDAQAQVRCALFRPRRTTIKFPVTEGLQVLAKAHVSLYEGRGDFQLIVETLQAAGVGALQQAFEALKQRLAKEGLFALERKRSLPTLPRCIGVITSASGAAIRDILTVLRRRFSAIPVIIYPSLVQGNEATQQLIQAIQLANQHQTCDLLILARGGGSIEDLWCFNDEQLARTIVASAIPIATGIGHEVDLTIADLVADYHAPTPSAAAEACSPDAKEWLTHFRRLETHLTQRIQERLVRYQQEVFWLQKRLRHPSQRLQQLQQHLDHFEQRLLHSIKHRLALATQQLNSAVRALSSISPLATLDRGYAIVKSVSTQAIIKNHQQVHPGEHLSIQLAEGNLLCEVIST